MGRSKSSEVGHGRGRGRGRGQGGRGDGQARRMLEVARKIKAIFSVSNVKSMAIMPIVVQERRKRRRRITLVRRWSQR